MKIKHRLLSYVVLALILIILAGIFIFFPNLKEFASPDFVRTFILGFGALAFVVYMVLITLAVPLPIPSTAVILAGGLGTRLLPLTKKTPKPMLLLGKKPINISN